MELVCKKCGSTAYHKSGHIHGKQRYKCKQCGHQYTKTTPQGKPEKDKIIAVLSGLSMNATAKNYWRFSSDCNALDQKDV